MTRNITPGDLLQRAEFIAFVKRLAAAQARAESHDAQALAAKLKEDAEASAHYRRIRRRRRHRKAHSEDDGASKGIFAAAGAIATATHGALPFMISCALPANIFTELR
jgi:hypothetical protein